MVLFLMIGEICSQRNGNSRSTVISCINTTNLYTKYLSSLQIAGQLDTFKKHLEEFASKHKNEIRKNPEFRNHFQQMCARIGVDPLACKPAVMSHDSHMTHVIREKIFVKS